MRAYVWKVELDAQSDKLIHTQRAGHHAIYSTPFSHAIYSWPEGGATFAGFGARGSWFHR